tara:strand:- start:33 stop:275 length:243 start_codon:yes stop_codon:yes gene_type:complete
MNSDTESSYEWNTVNRKKKYKKEDDMIVFFRKIKKELDEEFHFLHKTYKKKHKTDKKDDGNKKEKFKPQNIFSLLLSDSE